MADQQAFVIDRVGWHTQSGESAEEIAVVYEYFRSLISFLQQNGLVVRTILKPKQRITDDTEIASTDLTEEGLHFMRTYFEKWLSKVDNGMAPTDLSVLEKGLAKLRKSQL